MGGSRKVEAKGEAIELTLARAQNVLAELEVDCADAEAHREELEAAANVAVAEHSAAKARHEALAAALAAAKYFVDQLRPLAAVAAGEASS